MPAAADPPAPVAAPTAAPGPTTKPAQDPALLAPATTPTPPAKKGSAMERLRQDLRKKAGVIPEPTTEPERPPTPSPEPKPDEPPTPDEPPPTARKDAVDEKGKKVSPWRLVDQWKEKATKLETELAAAKTASLPEKERKEFQTRVEKAESRVKELEDEMRFVNYSKSEEFKTKYHEPYEKAWKRAMSELSELTIQGADGNTRPVASQDMLDLVNLPLAKARELANQLYGDFADDVMAHRKEIRSLFEAQNSALEEAKINGSAREKQRQEQSEKLFKEAQEHVKKTWDTANQAALGDEANGGYFKPIEGDQEWNQRLAKGFALVDRAFAENPMAQNLTSEERTKIVRRHAAVRNRAAAFGPMKYQISKLKTENEELKKTVQQYKTTSPPTAGGAKSATPSPVSAKDQVFGALRKLAK